MSLREEVADAVPMDPMHHGEEEEEVMLRTNAKSHEAERRRRADLQDEGPKKKYEAPETVFTRLGDTTKTVLTGPSDTTLFSNLGFFRLIFNTEIFI